MLAERPGCMSSANCWNRASPMQVRIFFFHTDESDAESINDAGVGIKSSCGWRRTRIALTLSIRPTVVVGTYMYLEQKWRNSASDRSVWERSSTGHDRQLLRPYPGEGHAVNCRCRMAAGSPSDVCADEDTRADASSAVDGGIARLRTAGDRAVLGAWVDSAGFTGEHGAGGAWLMPRTSSSAQPDRAQRASGHRRGEEVSSAVQAIETHPQGPVSEPTARAYGDQLKDIRSRLPGPAAA